jgi:hypothetical protein
VAAGIPVEGAARAWVRDSLKEGLGLSRRVLGAGDPADRGGELLALAGAPAGMRNDALGLRASLEDGVEGSFAGAVAGFAELLAAGGGGGGNGSAGRVLIIEDELSPPGDPVLAEHAAHVFLCSSEVFHWRPVTAALDAAAVTELLGSSTSGYPTNGFVCTADTSAWGPFAALAEADLDRLAASVEAVVVSAYDAEGLLWWAPVAPPATP